MVTYIGIDNGVSGSIGIIDDEKNDVRFFRTPVKRYLNYTKKKSWLNRLDVVALEKLFNENIVIEKIAMIYLERPMVNPQRWTPSLSAIRCYEATISFFEMKRIPFEVIDSKIWQHALLPSGLEKEELKEAAVNVARRLFPAIEVGKDADGLLIAEYCRRKHKGQI